MGFGAAQAPPPARERAAAVLGWLGFPGGGFAPPGLASHCRAIKGKSPPTDGSKKQKDAQCEAMRNKSIRLGPESVGNSIKWIGVPGQKRAVSPRFIEQVLDCLLVERKRIEAPNSR